MFRKFFAALIIILFIFIIPPFLIIQSFTASFLHEKALSEKIIPQSYPHVLELSVNGFSAHAADRKLFKERIEKALPQERYETIGQTFVHDLFTSLVTKRSGNVIMVDLSTVKRHLQELFPPVIDALPPCDATELKSEQFRFCKPPQLPAAQFKESVENIITRVMPGNLVLGTPENPQIADLIEGVIALNRVLPLIILVVTLILLGFIAIIIYQPWSSVCKWIGAAALLVAIFMGLFVLSVWRLPNIIPVFDSLSVQEVDAVAFLANFPLIYFAKAASLFGALGVLAYGIGIVIRPRPLDADRVRPTATSRHSSTLAGARPRPPKKK